MRGLLVPAALVALTACRGSGSDQPASATSTTQAQSPIVRACPLGVPETRVSFTERSDRVIVSFSTTKDRVDELRTRIAHQAGQNGPDRHEGMGHDGKHGGSHGHGLRLWEMPPSRSIIEDTPDGARLHVKPLANEDLPALTAKMRERVRALEDKDCP
jgi:hypothetical protein